MNVVQIQEIIPHRYPFLLVDRIEELVVGERAVGIKNVTMNEAHFQGHFPGAPVMPGVLILESMAQVGAVLLLADPRNKGQLAMFGGLDKVRFCKPVVPGDTLRIEVTILKSRARFVKVAISACVDDQLAVSGEFLCAVVDPKAVASEGASETPQDANP